MQGAPGRLARMLAAVMVAVGGAGCATAAGTPAPARARAAGLRAPSTRAAPMPPMAPSLARPAAAACTWTGAAARGPTLALRPGDRPFATVTARSRTTAVVPVGTVAAAPWLEVALAGARARGWTTVATSPLRPRRAFALGALGQVTAAAHLQVVSATRGRVVLGLTPPPALKPARPLRATVPCDALGLGKGTFDAGTPAAGGEDALLPEKVAVPLRATRGGPVVATWKRVFATRVRVVARQGDAARIVIPTRELVLTCWVPASVLEPWNPRGSLTGRDPPVPQDAAWHRVVRCPWPVPLMVHRPSATPARVGTAEAGTPLVVLRREDDAVAVEVGGLGLAFPAALWLPASVVHQCPPVPEPRGGPGSP